MNSTKKLYPISILILAYIAIGYILSSSYLGINGHHAWRQSDVYAHILSFMGKSDFNAFDLFPQGSNQIFDIPVYEYLIAKISVFLNIDALVVTRFFNSLLWILSSVFGYLLAKHLGKKSAGFLYIYLIATSPLLLHYYASPLPDVMSLAFSITGIYLVFLSDKCWKYLLFSLPFLVIATLIKSPIPFVFIVFYFAYTIQNIKFNKKSLIDLIKGKYLVILLLISLFLTALISEYLRSYLTGSPKIGFSQDPSWFFGTLEQRLSHNFWNTIWERLYLWGIKGFGYIYITVVTVSLVWVQSKNNRDVVLSALIAFLSGWLVFANVYAIHDYYQLPIAVIIFLSLAVSMSYIFDKLSNYSAVKNRNRIKSVLMIFILFIAIVQVLRGVTLSYKTRSTEYSSVEYLMKLNLLEHFLYVSDRQFGPTIGGYLGAKFTKISIHEFENNCENLLQLHRAVYFDSKNNSSCLMRNKNYAQDYVEFQNSRFYLNRKNENVLLIKKTKLNSPNISSIFQVYYADNNLVYIKNDCTSEDIKEDFFVTLFPVIDNQTVKKLEPINLKFTFNDYIQSTGDRCTAVFKLPNTDIDYIFTGQRAKSGIEGNKGEIENKWSGKFSPEQIIQYNSFDNTNRTSGIAWDDKSNLIMDKYGYHILFSTLQKAHEIKTNLDGNDDYGFYFYKSKQYITKTIFRARNLEGGGLANHKYIFNKMIEFDEIKITPIRGDTSYSIGSLEILTSLNKNKK